jgi:hypothetical protein
MKRGVFLSLFFLIPGPGKARGAVERCLDLLANPTAVLPRWLKPSRALNQEYPSSDESALFARFGDEVRKLQGRAAGEGTPYRALHAKSLGFLQGELEILKDLPQEARHGFLARPGTYRAEIRFSNAASTIQKDGKKDFRGAAVRVHGLGEKGDQSQDLVMTNKPRGTAKDARTFLHLIQSLERGALPMAHFALRHPLTLALLLWQQHEVRSLAAETFWSGGPIRMGDGQMVKYFIRPFRPIEAFPVPKDAADDYLTQELASRVGTGAIEYGFYLQFQTDPHKAPIENALAEWTEEDSPPVLMARLRIPVQRFDTPERKKAGDQMEFNPWNCTPGNEPVGQLNRARGVVYPASQAGRRGE